MIKLKVMRKRIVLNINAHIFHAYGAILNNYIKLNYSNKWIFSAHRQTIIQK